MNWVSWRDYIQQHITIGSSQPIGQPQVNTVPVVRSRNPGSGGAHPEPSEATAVPSARAGPRPPTPTLLRHIPSPLPAHTGGQGPASDERQHLRSLRLLLHPSALWGVEKSNLISAEPLYIWNSTKRLFHEITNDICPYFLSINISNELGKWMSYRNRIMYF